MGQRILIAYIVGESDTIVNPRCLCASCGLLAYNWDKAADFRLACSMYSILSGAAGLKASLSFGKKRRYAYEEIGL